MSRQTKTELTPWTCAYCETVNEGETCSNCDRTWQESDEKYRSKMARPIEKGEIDQGRKKHIVLLPVWLLTLSPLILLLLWFLIYEKRESFLESGIGGFLLGVPTILLVSIVQWIVLRTVYPRASRWISLSVIYALLSFLVVLGYFVGGVNTSATGSGVVFSYVSLGFILLTWLPLNYYAGKLASRRDQRLSNFFERKAPWGISFWTRWLSTPLLGIMCAGLLIAVASFLSIRWPQEISLSVSFFFGLWGACTGFFQWLTLRNRLEHSWWLWLANIICGAISWGTAVNAITGFIFVIWILGFIAAGPVLARKFGGIYWSEASRRIFLQGISWGIGGVALGLLQAFLRLQVAHPSPPNAVERWFTNLTSSIGNWYNYLWLVRFIGADPGKVFLYSLGVLVASSVLIASLTDTKDPSKNSSTIALSSFILVGSVIIGGIATLVWLVHWIEDRLRDLGNWFNSAFPVLSQISGGWEGWKTRHDPSGFMIFVSIGALILTWYVLAGSFSRRGRYTNNDLFTNIGWMAGILQVPLSLLTGFYTLFVFPTASYTSGALTTGLITLCFGWFFHTAVHLLTRDYGFPEAAASSRPYMTRLAILSAEELFLILALFFGIQQVAGVNRTIVANEDWQSAQLSVSAGDLILVVNTGGSWSADPSNADLPYVGGWGYVGRPVAYEWTEYSFAPLGTLVASVGMGSSMDIYAVGMVRIFSARQYGTVYLRINDNYLADNAGALQIWIVDITRLVN